MVYDQPAAGPPEAIQYRFLEVIELADQHLLEIWMAD
jgi:hypothetical protein